MTAKYTFLRTNFTLNIYSIVSKLRKIVTEILYNRNEPKLTFVYMTTYVGPVATPQLLFFCDMST